MGGQRLKDKEHNVLTDSSDLEFLDKTMSVQEKDDPQGLAGFVRN